MTDIYHITHFRNLKSVIDCGGLYCDAEREENNVSHYSIAHEHLKERRATTAVPVGPRGHLCDYVPFYFGPRSPMLFSNFKGYAGIDGQDRILHLVASAEAIRRAGLGFAFTDGHAVINRISRFYADLRRLDEVDWDIMKAKYWRDTVEDPDRKRRRQAEFLVHSFLPWVQIERIGVISREVATRVEQLIEECEHQPTIEVRRDWYYG